MPGQAGRARQGMASTAGQGMAAKQASEKAVSSTLSSSQSLVWKTLIWLSIYWVAIKENLALHVSNKKRILCLMLFFGLISTLVTFWDSVLSEMSQLHWSCFTLWRKKLIVKYNALIFSWDFSAKSVIISWSAAAAICPLLPWDWVVFRNCCSSLWEV